MIEALTTLQLAGRVTSVPSTCRVTLRERFIVTVESVLRRGFDSATSTLWETLVTYGSTSCIGLMHPPEGR
eukprot:5319725-Prymnesium_polylepis.2